MLNDSLVLYVSRIGGTTETTPFHAIRPGSLSPGSHGESLCTALRAQRTFPASVAFINGDNYTTTCNVDVSPTPFNHQERNERLGLTGGTLYNLHVNFRTRGRLRCWAPQPKRALRRLRAQTGLRCTPDCGPYAECVFSDALNATECACVSGTMVDGRCRAGRARRPLPLVAVF